MDAPDLSDLADWADGEVIEALNEIEDGLSDGDLGWVDKLDKAFDRQGDLSARQREIAENILTKCWGA